MRINARLDPELSEKFEFLLKTTNQSTTQVIKQAIEHYYAELAGSGGASAAELLKTSGFIGCAAGDPDLSSSYKEKLRESLEGKH